MKWTPPKSSIVLGLFLIAELLFVPAATAGTGDRLQTMGISPSLRYDGDEFANLDGGVSRGAKYLGDMNLSLALDGNDLLGWKGGSFFCDGQWLYGGTATALSGDAQVASNIEAQPVVQLYEAWVQQNLFDDHLSLLAGLYDMNSEFYRVGSAGLFLNSSFGIGPTFSGSGAEGPSIFPRTSFGLRVAIKPVNDLLFRVAAMDGVPWRRPGGLFAAFNKGDGVLLVAELAYLVRPDVASHLNDHRMRIGRLANLPPYNTKIAIGMWHYTSKFPDLSDTTSAGSPVIRNGSTGIYFLADRLLFQAGGRRISAFTQIGLGDQRVERFGAYIGVGLTMTGLDPDVPEDQIGLAVGDAINGLHYIRSREEAGRVVKNAETTIELTCLLQGTPWLAIQPDVQYILSPNTDSSKNALVAQFLFEISLN